MGLVGTNRVLFDSSPSVSAERVVVGRMRSVRRSNRVLVMVSRAQTGTPGRILEILDNTPGFAGTTSMGIRIRPPKNTICFAALFDTAEAAAAAGLPRRLPSGEKLMTFFLSPKVVDK